MLLLVDHCQIRWLDSRILHNSALSLVIYEWNIDSICTQCP